MNIQNLLAFAGCHEVFAESSLVAGVDLCEVLLDGTELGPAVGETAGWAEAAVCLPAEHSLNEQCIGERPFQ